MKYVEKFEDYQELAIETAIYPDKNRPLGLLYTVLGLSGEAGELANKVKKLLRDKNFGHTNELSDEDIKIISDELGDIMWYIANTCQELRIKMDDVARENLEKLFDRKDRGVLGGSGDNR